jgi:hypothetical protein
MNPTKTTDENGEANRAEEKHEHATCAPAREQKNRKKNRICRGATENSSRSQAGMKNRSQFMQDETQRLKKKMGRAHCSMHKAETRMKNTERKRLRSGDTKIKWWKIYITHETQKPVFSLRINKITTDSQMSSSSLSHLIIRF